MRGRGIAVGALLVIGTLLWTALGFGIWANRQALDTDNWVDTSGKLLEDQDIRNALGQFIVDRLYNSDEVAAQIEQVLPPRLDPLAKPAASGLKEVAKRNAPRILGTDAALTAWKEANRKAHETLLRIIESDAANGDVSLDLGNLFTQIATATGLPASAVDKLPSSVTDLQIASGDNLRTGR